MLRRVSVEQASVTDVSDEYGVSRPTFYQAKADFEAAGIAGLVPKKRGPRGPHKLQSDVLAFIETKVVPGEPIRARELPSWSRASSAWRCIRERSSALSVEKKRRDDPGQPEAVGAPAKPVGALRAVARRHAGRSAASGLRAGLIVLLHRGMWAWARVIDRIRRTEPLSASPALPVLWGEPCNARGGPSARQHGYDDY